MDILDEGIIMRHTKKNWLTNWINEVTIPWDHLSQILAIVTGGRGASYRHYFVLDNERVLSVPPSIERGVEGDDINDIAEAYGSFLRDKLGQNVFVYRAANYGKATTFGKGTTTYKPAHPGWKLTDSILVSRIDNIHQRSENLREALMQNTNKGFLNFVIIITCCMIAGLVMSLDFSYFQLLVLIAIFGSLGFLPFRHNGEGLLQEYLDFVEKKQNERAREAKQEGQPLEPQPPGPAP